MAESMTDDGLHIDCDRVFADRLGVVRARTSELLTIMRWLYGHELRATSANEDALRQIESSISVATHFAGNLKRAATK